MDTEIDFSLKFELPNQYLSTVYSTDVAHGIRAKSDKKT